MTPCTYCKRPAPRGTDRHEPCLEAYGLDHDPESEVEARTWLDDRRMALGQAPRWTVRAFTLYALPNARWGVALVQLDAFGYRPQPDRGKHSRARAEDLARKLNEDLLHVDQAEATRVVMSSMAAPGLDPVDVVRLGGELVDVADLFGRHGGGIAAHLEQRPAAGAQLVRLLSGLEPDQVKLVLGDDVVLLERVS